MPRPSPSAGAAGVNEDGVVIQLKAKREGLALGVGGDAIYIRFDN